MLNCGMKKGVKKLYQSICRAACENTTNKSHPVVQTYRILSKKRVFTYSPLTSVVQHSWLSSAVVLQLRHYSTNPNDDIPLLTDFPVKLHPIFPIRINNLLVTYFTIKPNLDPSFDPGEFLVCSKKVVEIVSHKLAQGDTDGIREMVTPDIFEQIVRNLSKFSSSQRADLAVKSEDVFWSFIDNITVHIDDHTGDKSIEILTIHHTMKGIDFENIRNSNPTKVNLFSLNDIQKKMNVRSYVLNYRFLRKFNRSGDAGDWIINALNHKSIVDVGMSLF